MIWKPVPIPGYEDRYEVSDEGMVRSTFQGRTRVLRPGKTKGYPTVVMYRNYVTKTVTVHRLVALAFLGPSDGKQVNHKDGNKSNAHVSNLEWVTGAENLLHAKETGLIGPMPMKFDPNVKRTPPSGARLIAPRDATQQRRARKWGCCIRCGKRPSTPGRSRCERCLEYARHYHERQKLVPEERAVKSTF